MLLVTDDSFTAELVKYNASEMGRLVTHVTWRQVPDVRNRFTDVLVEMPEKVVDFNNLLPLDGEDVEIRIISDFETLPHRLSAKVVFLKRPLIRLSAYFGSISKAA